MKINKDKIGCTAKISWLDPMTEVRADFKDFLKKPLAKIKSIGVIRHIGSYQKVKIMVLQTEDAVEEEDLTTIPLSLITKCDIIECPPDKE